MNWRDPPLPAKPQSKCWVISCWWRWSGQNWTSWEKDEALIPKMYHGSPEAQASIPPRLPREPPSHTASPSGDKLLLAVSPRCFSSLNGVKLFLNPKEYDPEGNGACSSDEMHKHETPEAALLSLAHPVRVNSRPSQLIMLETVLLMLFKK